METSSRGTTGRGRGGSTSSTRQNRGGRADSSGAASWEREGGGPETYRTGRDWESERGYGGERPDERARSEAWRGEDWRRGDQRYAGRNENMDWSQQARERGRHDAPYRGERGYGDEWRGGDYRREGWGDERRGWSGGQPWSEGLRGGWGREERERGGPGEFYAEEERGGWGREPRGEWERHGEYRRHEPREYGDRRGPASRGSRR